jgi:hypothetical protein
MNSRAFFYVTAFMAVDEMYEVICDNTVQSFTEQKDME